jgi:hypothetical protein
MSNIPEHITAWAAYPKAMDRGDLNEAERLHWRWLELLSGSSRTDADPAVSNKKEVTQPAAADGGIDWANVASEARTMVELNRSASESWQAGDQKGKRKPQDG